MIILIASFTLYPQNNLKPDVNGATPMTRLVPKVTDVDPEDRRIDD